MTEHEAIAAVLCLPAGYDIGNSGLISVRRYEYPIWAVEWKPEEFGIPGSLQIYEFNSPELAAECFIELRKILEIGLEIKDVFTTDDEMLANLETFKSKWLKNNVRNATYYKNE